jgi:hypothetical protein
MIQDDVIEMAKQAGFDVASDEWHWLEAFAKLVAAKEREACAKVCDELQDIPATEPHHCAEDIRARGEQA